MFSKKRLLRLILTIMVVFSAGKAYAQDLTWAYANGQRPPGWVCTQVFEPGDDASPLWTDNSLCAPVDIGLRYSFRGPIPNMKCFKFGEPSDVDAWDDNYLCHPYALPMEFFYSLAKPVGGYEKCVHINEPGERPYWADNYLCYRFKAPPPEPKPWEPPFHPVEPTFKSPLFNNLYCSIAVCPVYAVWNKDRWTFCAERALSAGANGAAWGGALGAAVTWPFGAAPAGAVIGAVFGLPIGAAIGWNNAAVEWITQYGSGPHGGPNSVTGGPGDPDGDGPQRARDVNPSHDSGRYRSDGCTGVICRETTTPDCRASPGCR